MCVCVGETAALGAGAGEGHAGDGARDAAEGEGGGALQDLGGARGQLPPASGQAAVSVHHTSVVRFLGPDSLVVRMFDSQPKGSGFNSKVYQVEKRKVSNK